MIIENMEIEPFINGEEIWSILEAAKGADTKTITDILAKAEAFQGLNRQEVAILLQMDDSHLAELFRISRKIKDHIYGNRIVMFAPLYVSDYCINRCAYCSYNDCHKFTRRRLTMDEVREEVIEIEKLGHKRIALEAGEDPENCPIGYILACLKTIYSTQSDTSGEIRRANVNIASTTVDNYKLLKEAGIGTYILFQETYHKPTYEKYHIAGPKKDYWYHTTAFDRAQKAGIDDVGGGVLFGLYDSSFEVLALMTHNQHLEETYGVGFHTISVPRIRPATGVDMSNLYPQVPDDATFRKLVAILRLAVPYTGIIVSTREDAVMRKELLDCGVTQLSACSAVGVGGYAAARREKEGGIAEELTAQFDKNDERSAEEIVAWLLEEGLIPSWCTACYRAGRTGDRFMALAKSGQIKNVCQPNALMTLAEYLEDYAEEETRKAGYRLIEKELEKIENPEHKALAKENIEKIRQGRTRDLFF